MHFQLTVFSRNICIIHIHLPKTILWPLCIQSPSSHPVPGNHWSFCYHDFSFSKFHINWMRKYVGFWVWILSLSVMLLRVISVVRCSNVFFILNNIPLYRYIIICLSIYLLMDNLVVSNFGVFYTRVI